MLIMYHNEGMILLWVIRLHNQSSFYPLLAVYLPLTRLLNQTFFYPLLAVHLPLTYSIEFLQYYQRSDKCVQS